MEVKVGNQTFTNKRELRTYLHSMLDIRGGYEASLNINSDIYNFLLLLLHTYNPTRTINIRMFLITKLKKYYNIILVRGDHSCDIMYDWQFLQSPSIWDWFRAKPKFTDTIPLTYQTAPPVYCNTTVVYT